MLRPSPSEGRRSLREWAFVNASSNIVGTLATLGVWFFVTPVILHHLGLAQYSLWVLATAIVAYAPLLDLGISDAITRYVAVHRVREDSLGASRFIAAGFWLYVVMAALTLVLTAVLFPFFAGLFHLPASQHAHAAPVLILAGLNVAVAFPAITNLAVLRGLQRYDLVNLAATGMTVLSGVVIVIVLKAGGNVVALAAIGAPMEILAQIPMLIFIRRAAPDLRLAPSLANRATVRTVLGFGAAQALARGARQIRVRSDEIIIGALRPLRLVAPYALVRRVSQTPGQLSDQLVDTLLPLAAQLHAQRDEPRLRELFLAGTRAAMGSYLLFGTSIALLADPFLHQWAGRQYTTSAALAPLLVAAGLFGPAFLPAENLLAGLGRLRIPVAASIAGAVLKLVLAVVLVIRFGVLGVAISSTVAAAFTFVPIAASGMRTVGVSISAALSQILVPVAVAAAAAAAAVLLCEHTVGSHSLPVVLFDGAAGSAAFLLVYLSMPSASLELAACRHALARLRAAARAQRGGSEPRGSSKAS